MYITRFKLSNFKSYDDSSPIEFTPGMNLVVGQNNAGKSALLEALRVDPAWNPHKSPRTMTFEGAPPIQQSSIELSLSVSREDLLEVLKGMPGTQFFLPYPSENSEFARSISFVDDSPESHNRLSEWFLSHDSYTFQLTYYWQASGQSFRPTTVPSFGLYPPPVPSSGWHNRSAKYNLNSMNKLSSVGFDNSGNDIGRQLFPALRSRIYVFRAERLNVGEHPIGNSPLLSPNAANLPAALNLLQSNRVRFERFNKIVRSILPQVPWISVRPTASNQQVLEILVWPFESHPEREDLAIPLKESGTGLGQVLAILYVVLTSQRPSVIVIDEPQSFLHPGAARKLIEVLSGHQQHQYIIATHSPSIVSAGNPKTVTLARLDAGATVLQQVNTDDAKVQETLLAELGARLSDVFGSDNVLWVEGQTEEICYRRIFQDLAKKPLMGTQVLGVRHTGDLEGDAAERTIEIYNKISSSGGLVPPAVGFLLDSECRSAQKKKELITKSNGLLHFLPRRMYENYLLNSGGIAAVANATENFRSQPVAADEVSSLLENALGDSKYYCDKKIPQEPADRLSAVDGKGVLRKLFSSLSVTRVRYEEVEHGLALTEWLIVNAPAELGEINDILVSLLTPKSS
jgi:predicted ATPase